MAYKLELYKDNAGDFRFRFKAPNGENMFASQGYKQKRSALSAIESIQKNSPDAKVDDQTTQAWLARQGDLAAVLTGRYFIGINPIEVR